MHIIYSFYLNIFGFNRLKNDSPGHPNKQRILRHPPAWFLSLRKTKTLGSEDANFAIIEDTNFGGIKVKVTDLRHIASVSIYWKK